MGLFSNLFKSKEDTLSEDLALLIVDYTVKFYNLVVSNLDKQYEEALKELK